MFIWGKSRLLALAFSAGFAYLTLFSDLLTPQTGIFVFFSVVDCILYSHYVMGFVVSRKQLGSLLTFNRGRLLLGALLFISTVSVLMDPEYTFIYFGFHFALTDIYARYLCDGDAKFFADRSALRRSFRVLHGLFLTSAFFYGCAHTFNYVVPLQPLKPYFAPLMNPYVLLALGLAYFTLLLAKRRDLLPGRADRDIALGYVLPDLAILGLAIWTNAYLIHWSFFVLYHISFWLIQPLQNDRGLAPNKQIYTYVIPTVAIACVYYVTVYPAFREGLPVLPPKYDTSAAAFYRFDPLVITDKLTQVFQINMLIGVYHIMLSLVLSSLNPAFIRQLANRDGLDPWLSERPGASTHEVPKGLPSEQTA